MSWSVSVPAQPFEEFLKAVDTAKIDDTYNKPELVEQWGEQLEAAKMAIKDVLSRDVFGHSEGAKFSASMTGHANHDGAGEGTAYTPSEFVHITVNRQP